MGKFKLMALGTILILLVSSLAFGQNERVDRATVVFSNPSKPGVVDATLMMGAITVKGYSGKEIIVEARVRGTLLQEQEKNEKAKGMRLIRSSATGLSISEEDNVVDIGAMSMRYPVDLTIQVPFRTSLKLSSMGRGSISVENVTGDIEATGQGGGITLKDVSGSVVANSFQGDLIVTFNSITPDKPMSFTSWGGDVDITIPGDTKADMKMNSAQGDIYSDFDITIKAAPKTETAEATPKGKYHITFDKTIYGAINGGGSEFTFKTFTGNIYIRKK